MFSVETETVELFQNGYSTWYSSPTFFTSSNPSALLFQNYKWKALRKDGQTIHYFYTAVTVAFEHPVHTFRYQ